MKIIKNQSQLKKYYSRKILMETLKFLTDFLLFTF